MWVGCVVYEVLLSGFAWRMQLGVWVLKDMEESEWIVDGFDGAVVGGCGETRHGEEGWWLLGVVVGVMLSAQSG